MEAKTKFNGGEDALYEICANSWTLCGAHLAEFADYSTIFNAAYIQQNLQMVEAAKRLGKKEERIGTAQAAREELLDEVPNLLLLHNKLLGYIGRAYPPAQARAHTKATQGFATIDKIRDGDWVAMTALITASQLFIDNNQATLLAEAGMNPDFPNNFARQAQKMQDLQDTIVAGDSNALLGTQNKQTANKIIYQKVMQLFRDAKGVFPAGSAILKQFTLAYQKRDVVGVGVAGIWARVTARVDGKLIEGATINIIDANNPKSSTTKKDGVCEILHVASGKYNVECIADGYEPKTIEDFVIRVGSVSRAYIELEKIATV